MTAADDWISLCAARQSLGVSSQTLRRLIEAGSLSVRRVPGARPKVSRPDVDALLEASTRQATRSHSQFPPAMCGLD